MAVTLSAGIMVAQAQKVIVQGAKEKANTEKGIKPSNVYSASEQLNQKALQEKEMSAEQPSVFNFSNAGSEAEDIYGLKKMMFKIRIIRLHGNRALHHPNLTSSWKIGHPVVLLPMDGLLIQTRLHGVFTPQKGIHCLVQGFTGVLLTPIILMQWLAQLITQLPLLPLNLASIFS
jgi:hypothetical protein